MTKSVFLLLAIIMITANVVNCNIDGENQKNGQQGRREQAQWQKVS